MAGSKYGYLTKIAIEYCEKHPDMPTRTLARLLVKNYPLDFTGESHARGCVQRVRGEHLKTPIKETKHLYTDTETRKKRLGDKMALPKSDYKNQKVVRLPRAANNVLLLSDIHIPYHDNKALDLAIGYGVKHEVNTIFLNGDTMDAYQGSNFIKDRRKRDLKGEIDLTRQFLEYLRDIFPKAMIYYKIGNHEERWENYLKTKAPELLGIEEFQLEWILHMKKYDVKPIQGRQKTYIGKLGVLHGHEFGKSVFSPVNPARGLFLRAKSHSIIGHHHQTSEHTETNLKGNSISCFSVGCLCGLEPEYMPINKWNHGFARIERDNSGNFKVENKKIINYEIR